MQENESLELPPDDEEEALATMRLIGGVAAALIGFVILATACMFVGK